MHAASISVWSSPPSADSARVSLIGNVTIIGQTVADDIRQCYLDTHPDAADWIPENPDAPHLVRHLTFVFYKQILFLSI